MDLWKQEALRVVNVVLCSPAGRRETWLLGGVFVLALLIVMRLASSAAGIGELGWPRRLLALALGLGAMLAASVALRLYVLPHLANAQTRAVLSVLAPLAAALFVGIPLQLPLLRARYGQALTAFAAAGIAAALLTFAAKTALGSVKTGSAETGRLLRHQEETKELLERNAR